MPASTGTEGRAGRLRAVHATASASTSRSTRNITWIRLLCVERLRSVPGFKCSLSRTCAPAGTLLWLLSFLVRDTSGHRIRGVWILWKTIVSAGQVACFSSTGAVGGAWWKLVGPGENLAVPTGRPQIMGSSVHRLSTRFPQVIHRVRGRFVPRWKTLFTGRPQVIHELSPSCPQDVPRVIPRPLKTFGPAESADHGWRAGRSGATAVPLIHKVIHSLCITEGNRHPLRDCCLIRSVSSLTWL